MVRRLALRAFVAAAMVMPGSSALAQHIQGSGDQVEIEVSTEFLSPEQGIDYTPIHPASLTLFDAIVEGQPVCALLDTGASNTVIDLELAKRLGLKSIRSLGKAKTAGAQVEVFLTQSARLEVPDQFVQEGSLVASPMPDITCPGGLKLGLALGQDTLGRASVFVDNTNQRIAFLPSGRFAPKEAKHLRLDWVDNYLEANLEGKPTRMYVDTGANVPLVVLKSAFDAYFSGKTTAVGPNSQTAGDVVSDVAIVRGASLQLAGIDLQVDAYVRPGDEDGAQVNLGNSLFSVNPVIFDAANEVIYVLRPGSTL